MFANLTDFAAALADLPQSNRLVREAARQRQNQLTKPPGSLGRLEEIALDIAAWQGTETPRILNPHTIVFAANHGVAAQGVSPYPPSVTVQMVANFAAGGAAINALAEVAGSQLRIVPLELDRSTADITELPAMSPDDLLAALNAGAAALPSDADLIALGEMGIANTTIAAALSASCFGGDAAAWTGPGTGLDDDGVRHKTAVVNKAIALHSEALSATDRLRCLGGRELAAIAGAVVAARHARIPVILDGYVATAAVAPLFLDNAAIVHHCFAGHCSAEPAHERLLAAMHLRPLLDLGMRLGEGTGATLAISILRAAVAAQTNMATFAEAGVARGSDA